MKRTGVRKRKAERKPSVKKTRTLRTMTKLIGLMLMCYFQALLPMYGMPPLLQTLLWTGYVGQILILSSRLFGIRMSMLFRVLITIRNMSLAGMRLKSQENEIGKEDAPK